MSSYIKKASFPNTHQVRPLFLPHAEIHLPDFRQKYIFKIIPVIILYFLFIFRIHLVFSFNYNS